MFKPIQWKVFPRKFIIAQIGFAIYGLAIALIIQAGLGTGPWAVLSVALADLTDTTPGTMVVLTGLVVLAGAILMKEQIGWATVGNILFIGPWLDFFLSFIPSLKGNLLYQVVGLLISIGLSGLATGIYISVNAGAGPRDSLMMAISRISGRSVQLSRAVIESLVVIIGWLLKGPVGIGTLLFALLIGPAVQGSFRIFKVELPNSKKKVHDSGSDSL
ncbi:MAG: hypothetical protein MUO54_12790 [Anaerolineales bacterium]|nr:hypothetical protein [Anaerolineales bacterium]